MYEYSGSPTSVVIVTRDGKNSFTLQNVVEIFVAKKFVRVKYGDGRQRSFVLRNLEYWDFNRNGTN